MKRNNGNLTGKRLLSVLLGAIIAVTLFAGIPAKNMSKVQAATTPGNPVRSNGKVTYDCIYFGNYPQSDASGKTTEPIKWRVLSVNGNDAFLVADQNLDVWETETMREWLNGRGDEYTEKIFISHAFTDEEQAAIMPTVVSDEDNLQDKIFLLSYDEVTNPAYGFSSSYEADETRIRKNTAYVARRSVYVMREGEAMDWWLRSPGIGVASFKYVKGDGFVQRFGDSDMMGKRKTVCPALHLDLSFSAYWSSAGQESYVDSNPKDESETEEPTKEPTEETTEEPAKKPKEDKSDIKATKLELTGISNKVAAGRKITLTPVVTPDDTTNKTVKWTSSNEKYATVDSKGVVTTKKQGAGKRVTITAVADDGSNEKATYEITIMKHAVKSIKLTAKNKTVKAGKKLTLKATVRTSGKKANKELQWTSSNEAYAVVTKKGVVKTKKTGNGKTVKITAKSTDGTNKKATFKIKIK